MRVAWLAQRMSPRKVLIVEDHAHHADSVRRLLEENGYAVRVAGSGRSGLEVAQTWDPDAILMGISMPDMSGHEAVSRLWDDARTHGIPVIATTVRPGADEYARGFLAGVARYLTKPLSGPGLLEVLDELIDARDRRARAPLVSDVDDLTALAAIEDREQVVAGLLEAVRRRVPCDVLALRCQEAGLPHVLVSLASPVRHAVLLAEMAPELGIDPRALPRLRVITGHGSAGVPPVAPSVRARMTVPLCHGDEPVGILILGCYTRDAFDPRDEQTLSELAPALARLCCNAHQIPAPDRSADPEPGGEIDLGLLLPDPGEMISWQGRIEACLPGVRVHVFSSPEQLAESRADLHVVLVAPAMRAAAETVLRVRARQGRPPFPLVELRAADVERCDELLRAMLLMALLVGFGEGRRSGCLRLFGEDGSQVGEICFRDGRVEWAARDDTEASLLGRLAERTGAGRRVFVRAVQRALEDGDALLDTIAHEGLIEPAVVRVVLRDYVATIVRELLRTPRATVAISSAVPPRHFDASFDVTDLALGLFDA